ncbi:hypothetical protein BDW59DRAFT_114002 [Aspergillus cavernicola]|uniref:DNA replication regulator SLD2 n=1 Tax=Aspergillus cavernicola TaxID=176166 RepID=A0ABR4HYL0_9EURO
MPRTLPWLTGISQSEKASNSPALDIKRTSSPRVNDETSIKKGTFTSKRVFLRSSPSPPSSPIHRCPSEEFLREGLDNDDIHIMVEDEFYTVAQSFTQHLHYAEYVRRKKEAKVQNAATIADLARPTDGITPMSAELRKKYAAEELRSRQRDGVEGMQGKELESKNENENENGGDDIEVENAFAGTHLRDLMLSPRRGRMLVGLQRVRSSTRAAAGFVQTAGSRSMGAEDADGNDKPAREAQGGLDSLDGTTDDEDEDDGDDDDLDGDMHWSTPTLPRNRVSLGLGSLDSTPRIARRVDDNPQSISNLPQRNHVSESLASTPQIARPSDNNSKKVRAVGTETRFLGTTKAERRLTFDNFDTRKNLRATESVDKPMSIAKAERRSIFDDFDNLKKPRATVTGNKPSTAQAKRRMIFDDFDEIPGPRKPSTQPKRRHSDFTNTQQMKLKRETGSKKSKLNEVPTFLI